MASVESAFDHRGSTVALRQVYRSAEGASTALYHPDRKIFYAIGRRDPPGTRENIATNLIVSVDEHHLAIVATKHHNGFVFSDQKLARKSLHQLSQNAPIVFLYPYFTQEGLANISILRRTQDYWERLSVHCLSLFARSVSICPPPEAAPWLERFTDVLSLGFKLDPETNASK